MSLWFCGTGAFAARCLQGLCGRGVPVELAITQPSSRKGRGLKDEPSLLESAAQSLGIEVARTARLNDDEILKNRLAVGRPDALLVVDFGQKVHEPWLSGALHGCLNIHPSLLPRWRGAAPIPRCLMAGDVETGVTVFALTEVMDGGPIWLQARETVAQDDDSGRLLERLADRGAALVASGLKTLLAGRAEFRPQDETAVTVAPKIGKAECRLDWERSAVESARLVRALSPAIGAWFEMSGGRVKVWRAAALPPEGLLLPGQLAVIDGRLRVGTVDGQLELVTVQPAGKRSMEGSRWAHGLRLKGTVRL